MSSTGGVGAPLPPAPVPNAAGTESVPSAGGPSADTQISTVEDLKTKARPLYDAIMMALAMHIKEAQQRSTERIKQIREESER